MEWASNPSLIVEDGGFTKVQVSYSWLRWSYSTKNEGRRASSTGNGTRHGVLLLLSLPTIPQELQVVELLFLTPNASQQKQKNESKRGPRASRRLLEQQKAKEDADHIQGK